MMIAYQRKIIEVGQKQKTNESMNSNRITMCMHTFFRFNQVMAPAKSKHPINLTRTPFYSSVW